MVSAPSPSLTRECCERVESVVFLPLKDEIQDLKFGDAALTVLDELRSIDTLRLKRMRGSCARLTHGYCL